MKKKTDRNQHCRRCRGAPRLSEQNGKSATGKLKESKKNGKKTRNTNIVKDG